MRPNEISVDRSEPGVAVLALRGEHEAFSAPKLSRQIEALLGEGLAVVIDLTEADFLDSSVVAALLRGRADARTHGSNLALVLDDSTGWSVRRLLDVTGLSEVFDVVGDRAAAFAAVRAG